MREVTSCLPSPCEMWFSVSRSFTVGKGVLVDILLRFDSAQRQGENKTAQLWAAGEQRPRASGPCPPWPESRSPAWPGPCARGPRGSFSPSAGGRTGSGPAGRRRKPQGTSRASRAPRLLAARSRSAAELSPGGSTRRGRQPLKRQQRRRMERRWSARQAAAACRRRPWREPRRRRPRPAAFPSPARFPPGLALPAATAAPGTSGALQTQDGRKGPRAMSVPDKSLLESSQRCDSKVNWRDMIQKNININIRAVKQRQ